MEDKQVATEIRIAIKQGDKQNVASLIGSNKHIRDMSTPFGTWLHIAAAHGKMEIARLLIDLGANVNANGGIANGSALNLAASSGNLEIVKCLLVAGATLDVSEPERNPLFSAIYGGHFETVKFLIEAGIDFRASYTGASMCNMNALAFARERGQTEIADYLAKL
jgi:ankyrin repeat protein